MIKKEHSKASLFLVELMINIVFFFILLSFCLRFFIKTENLSKTSADIQFAVCTCENIAAIYKSGDGSFDILMDNYPQSVTGESSWMLYFDKKQKVCRSEEAYYILEVSKQPSMEKEGTLAQTAIKCKTSSGSSLHEISVYHYSSLHPQTVKGGEENE